jgi:hypothetical protein
MGGIVGGWTSWLRLLRFLGLVVDVVLPRADNRAAANRSVAWRVLAHGTGNVDQEAAGSDRRITDALNHADGVERVRGTSTLVAGDGAQSDAGCRRRVASGLDRAAE